MSCDTPDSFTGAEKPRSNDAVGAAATSSNTKRCSASFSSSTRVPGCAAGSPSSRVGNSEPSSDSNPIATGMTSGCLSGCPGVGAVRCRSVSV